MCSSLSWVINKSKFAKRFDRILEENLGCPKINNFPLSSCYSYKNKILVFFIFFTVKLIKDILII